YPSTLSGGQKQRASLARAIVRKPEILLLDEPLSALDNEMRLKLQDYILKVHRLFNLTTILVSHDISEIFKMSDRVVRLNRGKITNEGIAAEVFKEKYISGKFRFTGDVLKIESDDVVYIVSVLVGNNIIKVIATQEEIENLKTGDKVMIVSKAFNPLIIKL
ncbi:MAG: ATP-binding cassette domain-containing protein, partial [Ignavibacteriaceae bacterium]